MYTWTHKEFENVCKIVVLACTAVAFDITCFIFSLFLGTFAKLRKATLSFVISACPSVRPHGTSRHPLDWFHEIWYLNLFRKFVEKFEVLLKFDKNNGYLSWRRMYTECPRRNVPNFGRVFLRLKYTDITQNTYIKSWTVTEIMARENCGLLAVPRTVPAQLMQSAGQVQYAFSQRPALLIQLCSRLIPKCAVSKR